MTQHFAYPLPIYAGDSLQVFGAPCTLCEALELYHEAALSAHITCIKPRIIAKGVVIKRHSSIWVEWDHFDATGAPPRTSQARYFLAHSETAQFPKIEMVEYMISAFPQVTDSFAVVKRA